MILLEAQTVVNGGENKMNRADLIKLHGLWHLHCSTTVIL